MELQLVNFEQAKELKELGFPQYLSRYCYNNKTGFLEDYTHNYSGYIDNQNILSIAPYIEEVINWLRKNKNLDLYVRPCYEWTKESGTQKIRYTYELPIPKECLKIYPSYEEALSVGLDKAIKILKENEN